MTILRNEKQPENERKVMASEVWFPGTRWTSGSGHHVGLAI